MNPKSATESTTSECKHFPRKIPRLCCSQEEAVWIRVWLPRCRPKQQHDFLSFSSSWHISDTNRHLNPHQNGADSLADRLRSGLQQRVDATIVHTIISLALHQTSDVSFGFGFGKTWQGWQRFWRCSPWRWQNGFCDLEKGRFGRFDATLC